MAESENSAPRETELSKTDQNRKVERLELSDLIGSLNYFLSFDTQPLAEFISREKKDEMLASGDPEKIAKVEKYNRNLHVRNRLYAALDAVKIFAEEKLPEKKDYFVSSADQVISVYQQEVETLKKELARQGGGTAVCP